jgi:hypothetical protein
MLLILIKVFMINFTQKLDFNLYFNVSLSSDSMPIVFSKDEYICYLFC